MENEKTVLFEVKLIEGSPLHFRYADGRECYKVIDHIWHFDLESLIIGDLLGNISDFFLYKMHGQFMLENTVRLNMGFYDSDSFGIEIKERTEGRTNYFRLGSYPNFARIGSNICSISRSHFHNLTTAEKRLSYLAERVYESLMTFCKVFEQNTSEIIKAYEEIKTVTDWYIPSEGNTKATNKQGTHKVWIQRLSGFDKNKFRLAVQNQYTLEQHFFFIDEKDSHHTIYKENNLNHRILNGDYKGIPGFSFEVLGWKKKGRAYQFKWGEEEFYEFSLDTMQLVKK